MLHLDLSRFDGKSTALLEEIARRYPPTPEHVDHVIGALGDADPTMQTGGSWLLRRYLEEGARLTPEQVGRVARVLESMADGFGRLHLCQMMGGVEVPPEEGDAFARFFRSCAASRNTFLRAWAPYGMWALGERHEAYRAEARAMVESALTDPAASVRARARRTLEGGWRVAAKGDTHRHPR